MYCSYVRVCVLNDTSSAAHAPETPAFLSPFTGPCACVRRSAPIKKVFRLKRNLVQYLLVWSA